MLAKLTEIADCVGSPNEGPTWVMDPHRGMNEYIY